MPIHHILDHTGQQLLSMDSPFALIVLAAQKALLMGKIPEQELGEQRLTIARALIQSKQYDSEQIKRFLFFLKTFIYIENPEINSIFNKEIDLLTGNRNAMGIIETIKMLTRKEAFEDGEEKKSREFVKDLLQDTKFDVAEIAKLSGTSETFVRKIQQDLK